jgi:hypothetical protein
MADPRAIEINGDEEEDEALRIAIALSLGQDPAAVKSVGQDGHGVIDLTQEDEEDDDDGGNPSGVRRDSPAAVHEPAAPAQQPVSTSVFTSLGLDRKKMEEERLARLGKRKASQLEDDHPPVRSLQRPRMAGVSSLPSAAASTEKEKSLEPKVPTASASTSAPPRIPFPHGVVKKTWAFGQPRQGDDIKIEEVLQKHQLQLAVLSSFQWDEEWMLSKIDLARTKLILVAFAVDEAQVRCFSDLFRRSVRKRGVLTSGKKEVMRNNVPKDRIRFCFPPMQHMGAMHSKLMLLKFDTYMRIVVPTANFMSYDWGETGTMENVGLRCYGLVCLRGEN